MRTFTLQQSKTEVYTPHAGLALDMDVFPMDNSQTSKEGVSYTYKGYEGYAPLAAYSNFSALGQCSFQLGNSLNKLLSTSA